MDELNANYWTDRYRNNQTGWDLGAVSPPLREYFDQLEDKNLKILIPGCGRGYEGLYLLENGFKNVYFADFSEEAIKHIKKARPEIRKENLICKDYFKIEGQFDLIIEQTMFCAIDPTLRSLYVKKTSELISPKGKLVGLLFNKEFVGGPPFGGNENEYRELFETYFEIIYMDACHNSIEPRLGTELFIKMIKK